jgi:hypothetical protein
LNERISDLGNLIGLVLVLLPLFTSQRASALRTLRRDPRRDEAFTELLVTCVLLVLTGLLIAAGIRLWWDTAWNLHPGGQDGAVRSVFIIALLLLVGLLAWQVKLVSDSVALSRKLNAQQPKPTQGRRR